MTTHGRDPCEVRTKDPEADSLTIGLNTYLHRSLILYFVFVALSRSTFDQIFYVQVSLWSEGSLRVLLATNSVQHVPSGFGRDQGKRYGIDVFLIVRLMEATIGEVILDLTSQGTPVENCEGDGDITLLSRLKSNQGIERKDI